MKLEIPNNNHKYLYDKLISQWGNIEELSNMNPRLLFKGKNFDDFLNIINLKDDINSNLFFLIDKNEIIGAINIRTNIEANIRYKEIHGHIGYGIAPKFRNKGYGYYILKLGLLKAKELNLKKVLITAKINYIWSQKIIEKNGGVYERLTKNGTVKRYWINL